ncbi:hypothetical protein CALCODRAFT_507496 [Calocera cornea HHB12733]|uniref:DUF6532 domain-containing protein n=1 Tax=Calocera cornea HHB12733 TaxID=1353952 RepID=A0A165HLN9_9BASI|nr:hypothetical protein CALCODRAFT_507496 [Calocera cornea HHB12733]
MTGWDCQVRRLLLLARLGKTIAESATQLPRTQSVEGSTLLVELIGRIPHSIAEPRQTLQLIGKATDVPASLLTDTTCAISARTDIKLKCCLIIGRKNLVCGKKSLRGQKQSFLFCYEGVRQTKNAAKAVKRRPAVKDGIYYHVVSSYSVSPSKGRRGKLSQIRPQQTRSKPRSSRTGTSGNTRRAGPRAAEGKPDPVDHRNSDSASDSFQSESESEPRDQRSRRKTGSHARMRELSPCSHSIVNQLNHRYRVKLASENAFPTADKSQEWVAGDFKDVTEELGLYQSHYAGRYKKSRAYRENIKDIVLQRQSQLRGEIKSIADSAVRHYFIEPVIGDPDRVAEEVAYLMEEYRFLFKDCHLKDSNGKTEKPRLLYEHPIIGEVFCRGYYKNQKSEGVTHRDTFSAKNPALLALPITAIEASLSQWSTGVHKASASHQFSASHWVIPYQEHSRNAQRFSRKWPDTYHHLMDDLLRKGLALSGFKTHEERSPIDYITPLMARLDTATEADQAPPLPNSNSHWGSQSVLCSDSPTTGNSQDLSMDLNAAVEAELAHQEFMGHLPSCAPREPRSSIEDGIHESFLWSDSSNILPDPCEKPSTPSVPVEDPSLEIFPSHLDSPTAPQTTHAVPQLPELLFSQTGSAWRELSQILPNLRKQPHSTMPHLSAVVSPESERAEGVTTDEYCHGESHVELHPQSVSLGLNSEADAAATTLHLQTCPVLPSGVSCLSSGVSTEGPPATTENGERPSTAAKRKKLAFGQKTTSDGQLCLYQEAMTPMSSPAKQPMPCTTRLSPPIIEGSIVRSDDVVEKPGESGTGAVDVTSCVDQGSEESLAQVFHVLQADNSRTLFMEISKTAHDSSPSVSEREQAEQGDHSLSRLRVDDGSEEGVMPNVRPAPATPGSSGPPPSSDGDVLRSTVSNRVIQRPQRFNQSPTLVPAKRARPQRRK